MAAPAKPQDDPVAPPPLPRSPPGSDVKSGSGGKDIALAKLEQEKKLSFIKAWEESQKSKVENRAQKRQSKVTSWENSKKASLEARMRKMEEELERKKAEYAEKMKNKEVFIHRKAEEKRAEVEARKGEELLKAEEMASKYRAGGQLPNSGCTNFFRH